MKTFTLDEDEHISLLQVMARPRRALSFCARPLRSAPTSASPSFTRCALSRPTMRTSASKYTEASHGPATVPDGTGTDGTTDISETCLCGTRRRNSSWMLFTPRY